MRTKYFNDGIVGNSKMTASFTKTGELIRLFYGSPDYKQFVDTFHVGVKINDSAIIYLHNDVNNLYKQEYIKNTNILQTEIVNTYFNLRVLQTDFIPLKENILVKNYKIKNNSKIDFKMNLLVYSKILSNLNNDTAGFVKEDCLIQYNHDYSVCTFSKEKLLSNQVNNVTRTIMSGEIWGKDYIGMSQDSGISYDLKVIKPGEEITFNLYVYINNNNEKNLVNDLNSEIDRIRKIDMKKMQEDLEKYWLKYLKDHDKLSINKKSISEKVKKIYNRSILLFPMLTNTEEGGISAGVEADEEKTKCGRYSYCWTRDAAFITKAFDIVRNDR